MLTLSVKIRSIFRKKTKSLRKGGVLPAVLYGFKTDNIPLEVDSKEFEEIYKGAGESTLISLEIQDEKGTKKETPLVLIHEIQRDPLTGQIIHVDFYKPQLTEEVVVAVPIVFEGISPAVKDLGGALIKEIQEVNVKALPQNLPHDIKVSIDDLKTFKDEILVKDLKIPEGVKILREPEEIVAVVVAPEKVEEELEKPIEEKVEEVKKVEEKKEEKEKKEEMAEKEEKTEEEVKPR